MVTKYIVNNLTGQTISGDLTITGELKTNSTGKYRALLTQTGEWIGNNISLFNGGLINGEYYTITSYVAGDDFSNIANVISGVINETGCVFIATGSTPSNWFNSSELTSQGGLVVEVLENTLGYDLYWAQNPFGADGLYLALNDATGPVINSFPREKTFIQAQTGNMWSYGSIATQIFTGTGSFLDGKDDVIYVHAYDYFNDQSINNSLYYTPIEITLNQDLDTTPVDVFGSVVSFPFSNVSCDIRCGQNTVLTNYSNDGTTVNNMEELVNLLNTNVNTNGLGVFSVGGGNGGIKLTMAKNLENQLCPDNELTFVVFND